MKSSSRRFVGSTAVGNVDHQILPLFKTEKNAIVNSLVRIA
jgi:hypothetical protein